MKPFFSYDVCCRSKRISFHKIFYIPIPIRKSIIASPIKDADFGSANKKKEAVSLSLGKDELEKLMLRNNNRGDAVVCDNEWLTGEFIRECFWFLRKAISYKT